MSELTDFLLARIEEDEADLSAAHVPEAYADDFAYGGTDDYYQITMGHGRARAECEAKRAIIELAQEASEVEQQFDDYVWRGAGPDQVEPLTGDAILFALAAVYKDHPDYRQEWANG